MGLNTKVLIEVNNKQLCAHASNIVVEGVTLGNILGQVQDLKKEMKVLKAELAQKEQQYETIMKDL